MTNSSTEKQPISDDTMLARYRRAEALENAGWNSETMIINAHISPRWIGDSDCFWYRRLSRVKSGSVSDTAAEYRLVNANKATNTEAFDHASLAIALAEAVNQPVDALSLPISNIEFDQGLSTFTFDAFGQCWEFDGDIKPVKKATAYPNHWLLSPDRKKAAFVKDYNLWVCDLDSGEEYALTCDGELHNAYAARPEARNIIGDMVPLKVVEGPYIPEAVWSPDSSRLFTLQTDERLVRSLPSMLYVPQDGTVAPRVVEQKYALPGDKHITQYRMLIIDVETANETALDYLPIEDSFIWLCPFSSNNAWWSGDGRYVYFVDMARGQKAVKLVSVELQTAVCKVLFEESSSTYVELGLDYEQPSMLIPLPETNELLWSSERSGWRHLYLYDLETGNLKNTVTSGDWLVRSVLHFNKDKRELLIQLGGRVEGRNPYYREKKRVRHF